MFMSPRLAVMLSCTLLLVACAQPQPIYEPEYGQPGKDVIWVPTPQLMAATMMDLAKVTPDDYVIDLGSGDGRLVIEAARRGARALGIEYDDNLVRYARREAEKQGVAGKARFEKADIFTTDFSRATVLTLFLLPEMNRKLRPQFLAMRPGTRIVANYFGIGDWSSDEAVRVPESEKCRDYCIAYLWIVPAKVDGVWQTTAGELTIVQNHQHFKGMLGTREISQGRIRGDVLNFVAEGVSYRGRVSGNVIEGVAGPAGSESRWTADRKSP